MSRSEQHTRVAGVWLAIAAIVLALALVFHGPPSPDLGMQMMHIADGSLRWSIVHWAAAVSLSSFAVASLIVLTVYRILVSVRNKDQRAKRTQNRELRTE